MEINITKFFTECAPMDYSASVAEIGNDAGPSTWRAAVDDSADYFMLDTDEKRQEFRDYVMTFGAWDDDEINAWSDIELNALLIQFIAGDVREFQDVTNSDWSYWAILSERGTVSGRLYSDLNGNVFYYVGN